MRAVFCTMTSLAANVRVTNGKLLLLDWEGGRLVDELGSAPSEAVIDTLDTMSVATLNMLPACPEDDIESAAYVIIKELCLVYANEEERGLEIAQEETSLE